MTEWAEIADRLRNATSVERVAIAWAEVSEFLRGASSEQRELVLSEARVDSRVADGVAEVLSAQEAYEMLGHDCVLRTAERWMRLRSDDDLWALQAGEAAGLWEDFPGD